MESFFKDSSLKDIKRIILPLLTFNDTDSSIVNDPIYYIDTINEHVISIINDIDIDTITQCNNMTILSPE